MKHKLYDYIIAWAEGAQIQQRVPPEKGGLLSWRDFDGNWEKLTDYWEYRIKPESKPDIVVERCIASWTGLSTNLCPNIRVTFDGETGELKKAEVL